MKKLTVLLLIFALYLTPTLAQKSKPATPAPRPAAPRTPPPYVLKKDYEAQIEDLKGKINAASSAASSARNSANSMENRLGQVNELDSQVRQIQDILNSASFQIAMNADSLKETRFSMETLSKKTDAAVSTLDEHQQTASQQMWMLFGLSVAATIGVLLFLLSALQKRMKTIESMLHKNEEVLKKSLSNNLEKAQQQLTTELQSSESRILTDMSILKREMNVEKERSAAIISELTAKLDAMNPNKETDTNPETKDSDTFI